MLGADPTPRDGIESAPYRRRSLARLIDTMVVVAIDAWGLRIPGMGWALRPALDSTAVLFLELLIVWLAYEVPVTALVGRTPGKLVTGVQIISLRPSLRVGGRRALVRWSLLVPMAALAGLLRFLAALAGNALDARDRLSGTNAVTEATYRSLRGMSLTERTAFLDGR